MSPEELRTAGFTDNEISDHLKGAGFTDTEINTWITKGGIAENREVSTITGEPVPTAEEKFQQSGQVAKVAGPMLGDIAATALMPQLSVPLKGASLAARLAPKAANLGLRMLGSAVGTTAGSVAGQKLAGDDVDFEQSWKMGALGAGGELATSTLGAASGALLRGGVGVGKMFARKWFGAGEQLSKKYLSTLKEQVGEESVDFLKNLAPDIVKKQAKDLPVEDLAMMVKGAKSETSLIFDQYEKKLGEYAAKNKGVIDVDNTYYLLRDLRDEVNYGTGLNRPNLDNAVISAFGFKGPEGMTQKKYMRRIMAEENLTPDELKYMMSTVFRGYRKKDPTSAAYLERLKTAMLSDIERATGAKELKGQADQLWKEVSRFDDVRKIYMRGVYTDKETGRMFLKPYTVASEIYNNKKTIQKFMPEMWDPLKKEADHLFDISKAIDEIKVDENFGAVKAWELMHPKTKKVLETVKSGAKERLKYGTKAGILYIGGQPITMQKSHE